MIYLIKTSFYNKETNKFSHALKIGYTNDIKSRLSLYHSDNPYIELLSTQEGDLFIEGLYHNYFKDYRLSIPGRSMNREWLEYSDEIVEKFDKLSLCELLCEYKVENAGERLFKNILLELFFDDDPNEASNFQKNYEDIISEWKLLVFREDFLEFSVKFNKTLDKTRLLSANSLNFLIDFKGEVDDNFSDRIIYPEEASMETKLSFSKEEIKKLQEIFNTSGFNFSDKMKLLCNFLSTYEVFISDLYWLPREVFYYIVKLGPKRIKALGYKEIELMRELDILSATKKIHESFIDRIFVGKRYSLKELKDIIKSIYIDLNLTKTPKATDILEYFNIKEVFIYNPSTKKQCRGYEILSLKS